MTTTATRRPAPPAHASAAAAKEAKRVQTANAKASALRAANAASLKAAQAHAASQDAAVLNGVAAPARKGAATRAKDAAIAAATRKPRSNAKAPASTAPKGLRKAARAPAKGKPAPAPAPAKPAAPSGDSNRLHNQALARRLVNALAAEFGKDSPADQVKVANWVKHLPTGDPTGRTDGAAGNRYWPKGMHRPTTADWAQVQ